MDNSEFWRPHVGAVSLTFDDGLACQLEKAVPLMDKAGIRGTFYLCPHTERWREDLEPWAAAARSGHEIGNHSISHTCSNNLKGRTGGLEDMTLDQIEADMLAAQERLVHIAPHQEHWTFAYPCYDEHVGMGASRRSYAPLVSKHFLAGRGRGGYGHANYPTAVDLAYIWAIPAERMSGYEMIGLVEEITSQGRWIVLVFHEIDGSRLTVASHDFAMLLGYLRRRSGEIWVAPLWEVAKRIAGSRAGA